MDLFTGYMLVKAIVILLIAFIGGLMGLTDD